MCTKTRLPQSRGNGSWGVGQEANSAVLTIPFPARNVNKKEEGREMERLFSREEIEKMYRCEPEELCDDMLVRDSSTLVILED
jgi:hypothetical protein